MAAYKYQLNLWLLRYFLILKQILDRYKTLWFKIIELWLGLIYFLNAYGDYLVLVCEEEVREPGDRADVSVYLLWATRTYRGLCKSSCVIDVTPQRVAENAVFDRLHGQCHCTACKPYNEHCVSSSIAPTANPIVSSLQQTSTSFSVSYSSCCDQMRCPAFTSQCLSYNI